MTEYDLKEGDILTQKKEYEKAIKIYLAPFEKNGKIEFNPTSKYYDLIAPKIFFLYDSMAIDGKNISPQGLQLIHHIYEYGKLIWDTYSHLPILVSVNQMLVILNYIYSEAGIKKRFIKSVLIENKIRKNEEINLDLNFSPDKLINSIDKSIIFDEKIQKYLISQLLIGPLKKDIILNTKIENFLITLRSFLLDACALNAKKVDSNFMLLIFLEALSSACHKNEFCWAQTEHEIKKIEKIYNSVLLKIKKNLQINISEILILSSYKNLYEYPQLKGYLINKNIKNDIIKNIIRNQILDPEKENIIEKNIKKLTSIDDNVSLKVKNQYENYPYPRWNMDFQKIKGSYSNLIKKYPNTKNINIKKILIAGCGTGFQPINIARYDQNVEIHAIDLSLKSLSYGKRKAKEFGINNIKWFHADLLNFEQVQENYDAIESTGVLHHMDDPKKGFHILSNKLNPYGIMRIALYSRTFRKILEPAKKLIQKEKIKNDIDGVRKARKLLMQSNNPDLYFNNADFFSLSTFIDLFMHEQEMDFDILELKEIYRDDFNFLGFQFPITLSSRANNIYDKEFPDDKIRTNLNNWKRLEENNKLLFASMYNFILQKN